MSALSITAVHTATKQEMPLGSPFQMELTATLDSPAESLRAVFQAGRFPGELSDIRVRFDGEILFEGKIDREEFSFSEKGMLLDIEARSKGALLLDNEALPVTLWGANLRAIAELCIIPYDFAYYNPNPSRTLAVYPIIKGMSEWDAFCGFARRLYSITPYVTGGQVMVDNPNYGEPLVISNTSNGIRFSDIRYIHTPYSFVSKFIIRDEQGCYSTSVTNPSAAHYGVKRKRYVIPGTEFADAPGLDSNQRMQRSMRELTKAAVTLPGIVQVKTGRPAFIEDNTLTMYNLIVRERKYSFGSSGMSTELLLTSSIY